MKLSKNCQIFFCYCKWPTIEKYALLTFTLTFLLFSSHFISRCFVQPFGVSNEYCYSARSHYRILIKRDRQGIYSVTDFDFRYCCSFEFCIQQSILKNSSFHKNSSTAVFQHWLSYAPKAIFEHQNRILEWFLKDPVTLKSSNWTILQQKERNPLGHKSACIHMWAQSFQQDTCVKIKHQAQTQVFFLLTHK